MDSHYVFASTAGGGLLRKPMNQPLNGVAEIPQTHVWNLYSWISPAIELVGLWNLRIRVSCIPNYKTAISDKITCWEGEQFPLKRINTSPLYTAGGRSGAETIFGLRAGAWRGGGRMNHLTWCLVRFGKMDMFPHDIGITCIALRSSTSFHCLSLPKSCLNKINFLWA